MGFDSVEEEWFSVWLRIAKKRGMVDGIIYHPSSFELAPKQTIKEEIQLKTKSKIVDKFLLHPHKYTPDFVFYTTNSIERFEHGLIPTNENIVFVDVKGVYAGGRHNNSSITFPISQKWVYAKFGIYINKVVPEKFFRKTFVPKELTIGKTGKILKKWKDYPVF